MASDAKPVTKPARIARVGWMGFIGRFLAYG
jgi:hypothetical protein